MVALRYAVCKGDSHLRRTLLVRVNSCAFCMTANNTPIRLPYADDNSLVMNYDSALWLPHEKYDTYSQSWFGAGVDSNDLVFNADTGRRHACRRCLGILWWHRFSLMVSGHIGLFFWLGVALVSISSYLGQAPRTLSTWRYLSLFLLA